MTLRDMIDSVRKTYLYDGVAQPWFSVEAVRDHLALWLPWMRLEVRGDPAALALRQPCRTETCFAERLCRMRVLNPAKEPSARSLLKPEIDFERRVLDGQARACAGVVYDGNELQRFAFGLLPPGERGLDSVHIWFTERNVATWDEDDLRYHARTSVYGQPSIVSTSGMALAPARDREYYLARRLGVPVHEHDGLDLGDALERDDPRIEEAAKGYAMQAIFHALTGDPFCRDPHCRLLNAHWQRELLTAQLGGVDYCSHHQRMLEEWAELHAPD